MHALGRLTELPIQRLIASGQPFAVALFVGVLIAAKQPEGKQRQGAYHCAELQPLREVPEMNVMLSARNAECKKGIHGLLGLDRLSVHIHFPALVIGDARKEQGRPVRLDLCVDCVVRITVYLHSVLQHGLPEFFQCVEIKAVHDDRGLGLIVGNLRKVDGLSGRSVTELHHIAPL